MSSRQTVITKNSTFEPTVFRVHPPGADTTRTIAIDLSALSTSFTTRPNLNYTVTGRPRVVVTTDELQMYQADDSLLEVGAELKAIRAENAALRQMVEELYFAPGGPAFREAQYSFNQECSRE